LHSHTDRSQEGLSLAPKYAKDNALIRFAVNHVASRYRRVVGRDLDFERSYYVPPLAPIAAYRIEALQIEAMDMSPMVSITDHDTITGPQLLQAFLDPETVPVSMEWTVPFGQSLFHVGIHNLPPDKADEIIRSLGEVQCTYCKAAQISCVGTHDVRCLPNVRDLLQYLSSIPDTLVVLNHPLWDVSEFGESSHRSLLASFLARNREWIHAVELNGLRSWNENKDVMALAERWRLPLISGGDRHGCEPNAVVNLTTAKTFAQFAGEIRAREASVMLFLRQYQHPLTFRKLRVAWDVLKPSDSLNGVRKWSDRVFMPWIDGRVLALSSAEWSNTLGDEPVEGPQPAECLPCEF